MEPLFVLYIRISKNKLIFLKCFFFFVIIVILFCFQRASQIRSMPFTGDSSDDSSDGEAEHTNAMNHSGTRATNSSSDNTGNYLFYKKLLLLLSFFCKIKYLFLIYCT